MAELVNPHDKFFKEVFADKNIALDFLRNYLPNEVMALLRPDSLEIGKDFFVDENLKESFADILDAVDLAGAAGYIDLLFEHKSFPFPHRYTPLAAAKPAPTIKLKAQLPAPLTLSIHSLSYV